MALLTNINGKFSVDTDGAASFNRIGASETTGFTFPSADGANGEVLKTNGLGTVSWLPDSNTGTVTGTGAANRVAYWTTASNISYNDDFKYTGANKIALGGDIQTTLADFSTIEIGNIGMIMSEKADSQYNSMFVSSNAYYASGWKRKTATVDGSTYISMYLGGIRFGTTPQGAADSAITWTNQLIIANNGDSTFAGSITGTTASFTRLDINASNTKLKGDLLGNADAAYDIGASGANRPRNLYLSNSINAGDITTTGVGSFGGNVSTTGITTSGVTNNFSTGVAWGTNLSLTNTNDDASPAILTFRKAPVSGYTTVADGDYVGFINFRMDNTNNDEFSWVEMAAIARDVTDGSEDSSFHIGTWGAGTEHPYTIMARSGNVGIGTGSPDMKLDVAGDIRARVASNVDGGFYLAEGATSEAFGLLTNGANGYFKITDEYHNQTRVNILGGNKFANIGLLGATPVATYTNAALTEHWDTVFLGKNAVFSAYKTNNEALFGVNTILNSSTGANQAITTNVDGMGVQIYNDFMRFTYFATSSSGGQIAQTANPRMQITGTTGDVVIGGTAVDQAGSFSIKSDGFIRGILASGSNESSLINAISGVSNGFQLLTNASNEQSYIFHSVHSGGPGQSFKIAKDGTCTAAGDLIAYSDKRLKSNIKTLDGSKVYDMRGVSFIKDNKKGSGVIAQEMQKIAPELVNDGSEYLGVAYGNLTGYLIEAIKELKAEIEELKLNKCNCNK